MLSPRTLALCVGILSLTLCSGATAQRDPVLVPVSDMPTVSIRLLFEAGSIDDPPGKEGLCALAARTLANGGTADFTRSDVVDSLYPLAGRIEVQVDKDYTVFMGHVTREGLEGFYPLLRDLLLHSRWDQADFRREKADAQNYIANVLAGADDEELGKTALESFIYGDGPYGHPIRGTIGSLDHITLEDARDFAQDHFCRSRLWIGIAGDYPSNFPEQVMSDVNSLPEGTQRQEVASEPPPIQDVEILLIEKGAPATAISIGCPILVDRTHPDYWALLLANQWLGEHRTFYGRLMNALRVQRGLNYGDYSYIEAFRQDSWTRYPVPNILRGQQFFSIWIRPVEPQNAHFALRQALRELDALVQNGIPEEDFENARTHLRNYYHLWTQGLHRRLGMAMDGVITGTGDYVKALEQSLETMTAEDVRRAVSKHLQSKNMKVAMVCANADSLAASIKSNETSPISYAMAEIPEANRSEDEKIQDHTLNVTRTEIVPAGEIFREKRAW
jgi:zinc protease